MPRPRLEKLDPRKRRRLLAAAAREFADKGFDAASVGRIAAEGGISKASIYYYFEDKVDLYAGIVEEAFAALLPEQPLDPDSLTAADFWPRLEAAYQEMMAQAQRQTWLAAAGRLVYAPPPPGADAVVSEQLDRARAYLARLLQRGQAVGVVRSDMPVSLLVMLVTAAAEAADRWMSAHWEEWPEPEMGRLGGVVFGALRRLAVGEPA